MLEEYTGEYLEANKTMSSRDWPSELLIWSGESRAEIEAALRRLRDALARGDRPRLCDLAYSTWRAARSCSALTLAIVATSLDDLREKVEWSANALNHAISPAAFSAKRVSFAETPLARDGCTAFLFPGQGSQYPGMLNELAIHFGEVRTTFEQASRVLARHFPQPLSAYVFPPPRFCPEDRQADLDALTATAVAQPALGASAVALHRLLSDCSVHADMVAGHSYGEYAALWAAGSMDEETLWELSETRGRCIAEGSAGEPGSMAAVAADHRRTAALVDGINGVWLANINAPSQTVISGKRDAITAAIEQLERAGIASRRLPVSCAFHSPLMTGAREQLARIIHTAPLKAPRLPVFSNVSAKPYPEDAAEAAELLIDQLVRPVRFAEQIQAMYDAGARVFIELGPASSLSGLVNQILGGAPHVTVPMDVRNRSGLFQFQYALGELAAHGVPVNLDSLYSRRAVRLLGLDSLAAGDPEPTSATMWTVTGGQAAPLRPASPAVIQPKPSMPEKESHVGPVQRAAQPAAAAKSAPAPVTAPVPVTGTTEEGTRALVQFQQLMASFLETQKQVMVAYLTGNATAMTPVAGPPRARICRRRSRGDSEFAAEHRRRIAGASVADSATAEGPWE